ncbi:hypothetical protein CE91St36_22800 [Christensenellaceae bacterium]|nr:hypothetical protein CE91St36_22800 [Christensenellaceae bacterium]BDF62128.1 hypothetical protein CE91St37_22780 [Christensenellaceae bacterium]
MVVSDILPENFQLDKEPFDEVVYAEDLHVPVDNIKWWIFTHTVVEICTAVKGQALMNFLNKGISDKVVYLDPDIVVYDDLKELENLLNEHDVILTPHLTAPEKETRGILDNELCALMHGVYNLGFVAVRNSDNGMKFAEWWRDRLVEYCYDDIPNGIFTDQRWVDMAPAVFDGVFILREPNYNVATWNISNRDVTKKGENYFVNGKPLQFYHFSGFDSGAQEAMLKKYGKDNPALLELRNWYIDAQNENGQQELGKRPSAYATFSNGELITKDQRFLLRMREDLKDYFKDQDPFDVKAEKSFYQWYQEDQKQNDSLEDEQERKIQELEAEIARLRKYLAPAIGLKRIFSKKK